MFMNVTAVGRRGGLVVSDLLYNSLQNQELVAVIKVSTVLVDLFNSINSFGIYFQKDPTQNL